MKTDLILDAILRLGAEHPVDVVPTFLGAHAVPLEYQGRTDDYVDLVVKEMLPAVKRWVLER
jgi:imidazolonepropionase